MSKCSYVFFSGTSHVGLAKEISEYLGVDLGNVLINKFPDGEIGIQILENVRGRDAFVLQTIARDPNLYLMELLILVDALKRASARSITAVIPYYGYSRQDRKDKGQVPITAKLVANLLEKAGVTRVLTMDLHSEQIQGFFDIPLDHLYARPVFVNAIQDLGLDRPIVVTPDVGSIKLSRLVAHDLNTDFAIIDKHRVCLDAVKVNTIIGDVEGRDVVLVDDVCSTGATLKSAFAACMDHGAKKVVGVVTHALFDEKSLQKHGMDRLIVTNTVPLPAEIDQTSCDVVSVASLFGKAILRVIHDESWRP